MIKEPLIFLKHIIECIEKIEKFTNSVNKGEFMQNEEKQSAVLKQIETIGEAVRNIPIPFTKKYSFIEWSKIIGMRNKLSHGYFDIDLDIVWNTITDEIPKLKKGIQEIIKKEEKLNRKIIKMMSREIEKNLVLYNKNNNRYSANLYYNQMKGGKHLNTF
jgi:uncharacterized protein with HEPN domain